ncbi:MAG: hypothetical protein OHK0039_03240 [Bacteroidia bacterium]
MIAQLTTAEIDHILAHHYIGHLACCDPEGNPYLVPVTYYYDSDSDTIISYTAEGKKIGILRENPRVCLAVSEIDNLSHWRSVIINGTYEELHDLDAMRAIQLLITRLQKLVNDEGIQKVEYIKDVARADPGKTKVIYRINITSKSGRYEEGDDQ